jgi:rhodanese-related sulfurtransferase
MDMKVASTVAFEGAHNELLGVEDEDSFVRLALASLGPQPPNFRAIVELNRGGETAERGEARPLTPRQVELKRAEGALLVDIRTDLQFDDAHVGGAVAITALRAGFGSKLAWLADHEQEVVLIGRDDADALHAADLAAAVGVTRFGGYLAGGMTSWREDRRPVERIERVALDALHDRWEADRDAFQVLDVRERDEWDAGHIPGSVFTPYHDIRDVPGELDAERPIAVVCASGQRAAVGASLLQRYGAGEVWHVVEGGVPRWERAGWPTARP